MNERAPSVSLVIPVFNQLAYTRQCVESILRHTPQPYQLIIVDNASQDGTGEYLKSVPATVISNPVNVGCAKAWNQGVRASTGQVIGVLNNDIVLSPTWLEGLLAFMEKTGHGLVSPAAREGVLDYDLDQYAGAFTRRCAGAVREGEVYAACMLIHRRVFDRIGLFDEGFSAGGCEDIDFFWRMRAAGLTMAMTGSVLIHHVGMVTQDAIKATENTVYPKENLAYFTAKWKRTVRGNWFQRRWTDLFTSLRKRYELFVYGHTLVEKPDLPVRVAPGAESRRVPVPPRS